MAGERTEISLESFEVSNTSDMTYD